MSEIPQSRDFTDVSHFLEYWSTTFLSKAIYSIQSTVSDFLPPDFMYQRTRRSSFCAPRPPEDEEFSLDQVYHRKPLLIGNTILLYGLKNSHFPQQCLIGPDWPCMLVTIALIFVPTVFFLINVAAVLSPALIVLGVLSLILLLGIFLRTACSDPGIVFSEPRSIEEGGSNTSLVIEEEKSQNEASSASISVMQCSQCRINRPNTASHCYECNVCVDKLDHHCPWTGKCIGRKNIFFFYAFIWMLTLHIALIVSGCVYAWATHTNIFRIPESS